MSSTMFAKLRKPFRRTNTSDVAAPTETQGNDVAMTSVELEDGKKDTTLATATDDAGTDDAGTSKTKDESDQPPELPEENLQYGVRDVEAVTLSWSKRSLITVFIKCVGIPRCRLTRPWTYAGHPMITGYPVSS